MYVVCSSSGEGDRLALANATRKQTEINPTESNDENDNNCILRMVAHPRGDARKTFLKARYSIAANDSSHTAPENKSNRAITFSD